MNSSKEKSVKSLPKSWVASLLAAICCCHLARAEGEFTAQCDHGGEYHYYVFDWGDGSETPTTLVEEDFPAHETHRFPRAGNFAVRWRSIALGGSRTPWVEAGNREQVEVPTAPSGAVLAKRRFEMASPEAYPFSSGELLFQRLEKVDEVALSPEEGKPFPSDFRLEYCMDGGENWLPLPRYAFTAYPDPEGRTVRLPLHGLAARGIRLVCPRLPEGEAVVEMAAFGGGSLLFEADADEAFNAALNNMWLAYGSAENEIHLKGSNWWDSRRPLEGGVLAYPGAEWSEWAAMQVAWIANAGERSNLRNNLRDMVVGEDGFVWASAADPRHLYHSKHAVDNPVYILALHRWFSWNPDPAFWRQKDSSTGEPVLDKARRAMAFCLENMGGRDGLLTIPFPENDGTESGQASNYWDAWRFGYQSAYANLFFQAALDAMADIERWNGAAGEERKLRELAEKSRAVSRKLFWSAEKGRFVGCIDKTGKRHDYGFTFVNLPAVAYGMASKEQADAIMRWICGERTVPGEDATGSAIYRWKFAAVPNTVDAGSVEPHWWEDWGGAMSVGAGGKVAYGGNVQNGGAIFYLSYYDLMARLKWRGPDFALPFFKQIMAEFRKDELRRNPVDRRSGMAMVLGVIGPFPESGLVPLFYLHGLMGIEPTPEALVVSPRLPRDWKFAKATVHYGGRPVEITVSRAAKKVSIQSDGAGGTAVEVPALGTHRIHLGGRER